MQRRQRRLRPPRAKVLRGKSVFLVEPGFDAGQHGREAVVHEGQHTVPRNKIRSRPEDQPSPRTAPAPRLVERHPVLLDGPSRSPRQARRRETRDGALHQHDEAKKDMQTNLGETSGSGASKPHMMPPIKCSNAGIVSFARTQADGGTRMSKALRVCKLDVSACGGSLFYQAPSLEYELHRSREYFKGRPVRRGPGRSEINLACLAACKTLGMQALCRQEADARAGGRSAPRREPPSGVALCLSRARCGARPRRWHPPRAPAAGPPPSSAGDLG